jgi:hypothetical protein
MSQFTLSIWWYSQNTWRGPMFFDAASVKHFKQAAPKVCCAVFSAVWLGTLRRSWLAIAQGNAGICSLHPHREFAVFPAPGETLVNMTSKQRLIRIGEDCPTPLPAALSISAVHLAFRTASSMVSLRCQLLFCSPKMETWVLLLAVFVFFVLPKLLSKAQGKIPAGLHVKEVKAKDELQTYFTAAGAKGLVVVDFFAHCEPNVVFECCSHS